MLIFFFFFFFLVVLGLRCCVCVFSGCGKWGLLFVAMFGLLTALTSLVENRFWVQ